SSFLFSAWRAADERSMPWCSWGHLRLCEACSPGSMLEHRFALMSHQQIVHVVGVLFFHSQDLFEHSSGRGIVIAEVANELAIVVYRNPLRDQVLLDHVDQRFRAAVFRGGTRRQPARIEVRGAAELIDALGNAVHVLPFLVRVLLKLLLDRFARNALRRYRMHGVAQDAYDL